MGCVGGKPDPGLLACRNQFPGWKFDSNSSVHPVQTAAGQLNDANELFFRG